MKILSDIRIDQCPIWRSRTDYLLDGKGAVAKKDGKPPLSVSLANLWKKCRMYDVVITADIKTSQIFGLLRTFLRWKRPKHIILELMLDEDSDRLMWKMKQYIQRLCFASVEVIFVSARDEIKTYSRRFGLPEERMRFLPFHTNIIDPRMTEGTGGYILSAGRTGRDYVTLAEAVTGLNVKVLVVSDSFLVEGIQFPPNVDLHIDIPYRDYLDLLYGCSMVVVPLKKLVKSTGQVVFLEAMALGKPVVATATIGTEDYIEHGVTGILVPPDDSEALRKALSDFIERPASYAALARRAFERVKEQHTFRAYTGTILATAHELASQDNEYASGNYTPR